MGFDRVGRASQVDAAVFAIEHSILTGKVCEGECLPPERELATQLGVARLTLRAALQRVAASGLIALRHGSGNVVLNIAAHGTPALLGHLAQARAAVGDLAQLADDLLAIRRGLASAVLERLAAIDPPAADLDAFDEAIHPFQDLLGRPDRTSELCALADHTVVAMLVAISHLTAAGLFINPVFATLHTLPALRDAIYANPRDNVARWHDVGDWLRTKNRRAAPVLAALAAHDAATVARLRPPPKRRR